jgi:hypothetical protein
MRSTPEELTDGLDNEHRIPEGAINNTLSSEMRPAFVPSFTPPLLHPPRRARDRFGAQKCIIVQLTSFVFCADHTTCNLSFNWYYNDNGHGNDHKW